MKYFQTSLLVILKFLILSTFLGIFVYLGIKIWFGFIIILIISLSIGISITYFLKKIDKKAAIKELKKILILAGIDINSEIFTYKEICISWKGNLFNIPVELEYYYNNPVLSINILYKTNKAVLFEHTWGLPSPLPDYINNSFTICSGYVHNNFILDKIKFLLDDTRFIRISNRYSTSTYNYFIIPGFDKNKNIINSQHEKEVDILTLVFSLPDRIDNETKDIDKKFLEYSTLLLHDLKTELENNLI